MQCPLCTIELNMTSRQGVEIDYCPECRGVWLDRGELDKLIDRSLTERSANQTASAWKDNPNNPYQSRPYATHSYSHHERAHKTWQTQIAA